jgi:hypothetical protein
MCDPQSIPTKAVTPLWRIRLTELAATRDGDCSHFLKRKFWGHALLSIPQLALIWAIRLLTHRRRSKQ